ncbi:NAD(P)-dependent malic enzyme [Kordia sp.]|uniref:NAD(P)-dependent malic enzyme n=1 Tax=Kordia sp. TaxID=1965332 RepID=UPI003D2A6150
MTKHDFNQESLELHRKHKGKIEVVSKIEVTTTDDLSRVYSPGVAAPCLAIKEDINEAYNLTIKGNTIAVVSDGTAVLGLGNIGPEAAIPVMEGKAMLFKKFANVDAFPICLNTTVSSEIIETVKRIAPVFGGINLEDISAPRSFEIESALQDIGIPVFHDDQHGTAIVVLAGIINSCKVLGKNISDLKIVINGAGAAGIAISRLLRCISIDPDVCMPVKHVLVCDSKGIIHKNRTNLNAAKMELLNYSNPENIEGHLKDAVKGADVFIGVSVANILAAEDIEAMAKDPIIFALANPNPEIIPEEALKGGAAIIATGRSDYPNQVNNVLVFPGIFRGALDCRAKQITPKMKIAAAYAIAACVKHPNRQMIIPESLNKNIAAKVAIAVQKAHKDYKE